MKDDLITRQDAKVAMRKLKKWYVVCEEHTQKNIGLRYYDVMFTLDKLPSAQPEHLVKESGNLVKGIVNDSISRQAAIDAMNRHLDTIPVVNNNTMEMIRRSEVMDCRGIINGLPSAEGETQMSLADCISRQAAIDALTKHEKSNGHNYTLFIDIVSECAEIIRDLPSAQPEIIRCKDCRWKEGSECVRFSDVRPFPDDYCSRAERREDE